MNVEFITNDYLLAWCLLFKPSICEEIQSLKERLWKNYPKQYKNMEKDNVEILKYTSDFIPDDDTVYNFVFNSEIFVKIKKQSDKHRQLLMKIWDSNQKQIKAILKEVLRIDIKNNFKIIVVHPDLETIEFLKANPKKNIVWGKKEDSEDGLKAIMKIMFTLVKYEIGDYQKENNEIVSSIIDLAITNELYTRILGVTMYEEGFKKLRFLKRQLYPYFLMYMGADREELVSYMMRDRIPFDIDKYPIEKGLRKVDLYGFIDFCCNNQKYIIRLNNLEMI